MSTEQHVTEHPENPRAERDAVLFDRLERFVGTQGVVVAAETLGVNYRTLNRCLENGRLSRRVREAARKLPEEEIEDEPQPAAGVEQRVAEMEQAVEGLRQAVSEVAGAQAGTQARLARLEAAVGSGQSQQPAAESGGAGTAVGNGDDMERSSQEATAESEPDDGWSPPKRAHGMPGPGVVTIDVQDDEDMAFGPAAPLVTEWRELRARGVQTGTPVERARARERRWQLEVSMIGEFGLTLPPEVEPLDSERRHDHLRWRAKALERTRRIRVRRERRRTVRRVLTLGLWGD